MTSRVLQLVPIGGKVVEETVKGGCQALGKDTAVLRS